MSKFNVEEQIKALAEMQQELEEVKDGVEDFGEELDDLSPVDISFDDVELDEEDEEKASKIKTPEDAKKALQEAKKDIGEILDNFDALIGQSSEEQKIAKIKRFNEKYASSLASLASSADKAISEAKSAISHWNFLLKGKKASKNTSPTGSKDDLDQALSTIKKAKKVVSEVESLVKEGTAVPPTGAKFTGDKWPGGKNTAEVELRHWDAGANKFKKDIKWENTRVNPATDQRLTTVEYLRDEKPYVNASLHLIEGDNKFASYWDIVDMKENKRMLVTFASLPEAMGPKDDKTLQIFTSRRYGNTILNHIVTNGFSSVKDSLGGRVIQLDEKTLSKVAAGDKSSLRRYYTDAYGDASFAREATSGDSKDGMNVAYKPKDDGVKAYDDNTKDGPGKISKKEPENVKKSSENVKKPKDAQVLYAKASKCVELAKLAASRGIVEYSAESIRKAAKEYMGYDDDKFSFVEATYSKLPLVNEAALKEAHIPDTEVGIVGNPAEGVRNPSATVDTEGIDSNVMSDAKVASFVPQVNADNSLNVKPMFKSRIADNLQKKGALSEIKKATYKTS